MSRAIARGINAAAPYAGPTSWNTGGYLPPTTTSGTDTTPSVTETYVAEMFIPMNTLVTGLSLLNGSAVAGNVTMFVYDSNGAPVTGTTTASTAQSGTGAYQQIAFTAPVTLQGPAKYFVGLQCNNTGARFRSHILGNFGASKQTAQTYGTVTALTVPTTFTTALAPIAATY